MFKIEDVEIQDFRSHSSSKVTFDEGINVILGRNGVGKSSILEAIMVALYGARAAKVNKEDLIRTGAKEYRILLKFKLNNENYKIVRSSSGETFLRGNLNIDGDQKVTEWVNRLIPQHVFQNAVYIRQGEIDSIVADDESREKIIRRITKIENYENAWKALGEIIKEFKKEGEYYRNLLSQLSLMLEQLNRKRTEVEKLKKELEELERRSEEISLELEKDKKDYEELEKIKKELEIVKNEMEKFEILIKQKENEINILNEHIKSSSEKIGKLEKEVRELKFLEDKVKRYNELDFLLKEVEKVEEKILEMEKLEEKRKILEKELEKQKNAEKEIKNIEEKILKLDEKMKELSEFEKKFLEMEAKKVKLKELENEIVSFGDVEKLKQKIEKAKEEYKKVEEYEKKIDAKRASLKVRASDLRKILDQLKNADKKCPVCKRELTEEMKNDLLKNYNEEMVKVSGELQNLVKIEERVKNKKSLIEEILKDEKKLIIALQKVSELEKLKDDVKVDVLKEIESKKNELEKFKNERTELLGCYKALKDVLNKDVSKELEVLNENIAKIRGDIDFIKAKIGDLNVNKLKKEYESLKESYLRWIEIKNSEKELENEKRVFEESLKKRETEEKELDKLKKKYYELNKIFSEKAKSFNERIYEDLKRKIESEISEKGKIEEGISRIQKIVQSFEEEIKYLEKEVRKIKDYSEKADIIEKKVIPELEKVREKIKTYKNMIAESSLKEIEDISGKIFEELTDGKYNGIKLKRVPEKEKIKIFVIYQGEERDISFLSGGELISLAIAFRLALTMFLIRGKIPILILDEPTPFLDEERRKKLVEIISNYLRKIPQVIIVTHDDELKEAADKIIRVNLVGGVSKVHVES